MSASVPAVSSPGSPRTLADLPAGLRWLIRLLSAAAVAASLVYLALFARRNAAALPPLAWSGAAVATAGALLLYLATLVNAAFAWNLLLRSLGEPSRAGWAVPVHLLSQVGKYLPGNVGHYVGRVALAARAGLRAPSVVLTLAMEAVGSLSVGAVLAAATWTPPAGPFAHRGLLAAAILLALAATSTLAWHVGRRAAAAEPSQPLSARRRTLLWLAALALYALGFVFQGTAAMLVAHSLFGVAWTSFPALAGLYTAAWAAGFLVPGAPAGLGVREAVLVSGLGPLSGPGVALALPLVMRLVTTVGDGLGFALGAALRRERKGGGA